jgi:hypothetical protein
LEHTFAEFSLMNSSSNLLPILNPLSQIQKLRFFQPGIDFSIMLAGAYHFRYYWAVKERD